MEVDYRLDRDLEEARAMAEALENYVTGGELYGSVEGMFSTDPDMPTLTLGALLMRLHRLQALESQMTPEQKALLTFVEAENDRVRTDWREHYQGKLHNEAGARLHSLEAFFAECEDNPQACAGDYLPEAARRTMLEAIVDTLKRYNMAEIDLGRSLRERDTQIKRFTEPSAFIWDTALQTAYPQAKYWWLYERPAVEQGENVRNS